MFLPILLCILVIITIMMFIPVRYNKECYTNTLGADQLHPEKTLPNYHTYLDKRGNI